MIYISIDIETTGLNPETCDIIEFAAVADDLSNPDKPIKELPKLQFYIYQDNYKGELKALVKHSEIFKKLNDPDIVNNLNITYPGNLMKLFGNWLRNCVFYDTEKMLPEIVAAGNNFAGFSKRFLDYHFKHKTNPSFYEHSLKFHRRTLDPMMLYLKQNDEIPPSTEECLIRANLPQQPENHNALNNAITIVELLRAYFNKK